MPSDRLSRFFEEYEAFHRNPANKLCHFIGIPVIIVTAIGLLSRIDPVVALAVAAVVLVFDARLSLRLTVPYALFMAASFLVAPYLSTPVLWGLFIAGWVLQFVGHFAFEKNSPAFLQNLQQLLVAPLWIIEELTGMRSARVSTPGSAPLGE